MIGATVPNIDPRRSDLLRRTCREEQTGQMGKNGDPHRRAKKISLYAQRSDSYNQKTPRRHCPGTQRSIARFTLYKLRKAQDRERVMVNSKKTPILAPTQSWALPRRRMIEIGVPCSRDCQHLSLPCFFAPMPFLPMVYFTTTPNSNVNGALRSQAATSGITVGDEKAATPGIPPVDPTETRQPLVIGMTVTALFLSTFVTALRVHVRAFLLRKWGWDDSALVASSVLVFIVGLLMLINTHFGDGLHQASLPRDKFLKSQEIAITAVAIYQVAYPLIKSTFLLQYRRVFPLPAFQKLCGFNLPGLYPTQEPLGSHSTRPMHKTSRLVDHRVVDKPLYRHRHLPHASAAAADNPPTHEAKGGPNGDVWTRLLVRLPLPVAICFIGASADMSGSTCAISVIRLTTLKSSSTSTDATYNTVIAGIWSITELSCAIICLCVPTLRPLLGGQNSRARPPSYLRPNIEESADTELYTQSDGDGGVKSKTRRSRTDSCEHPTSDHREIYHDVEAGGGRAPHPRIDLSDVPGILPPPAVHITPYQDSSPYEDSPQRETTIPLTRVETEEGVRFLCVDGPEAELPTPLKPPPRRHTDRGPSPEDGGYFGAVIWDASGQPRLPGVSPVASRSSLVRDKGDSDKPS
ncbi:integral membrane protein [Colletotrichum acutatum]